MPKELVYGPNPTEDVIEHVAVGWARDGGVQLGFTAGPSVRITTMETDNVIVDGRVVTDVEHDSLWLDLDRQGINHLIRSLRKARDAAYGADA